jgi:preprotein translocase subunit YajC
MTEKEIRKIIREEIHRILIAEAARKGDKVLTPHGPGVVLNIAGNTARVKLNSGAVVKVHRTRAKVNN